MYKLILNLSLFFILCSCFKTAEQIKREEQVDLQLKQSQTLVSELSSQVLNLQNQVAVTTGQIEELDHNSKTQLSEKQQSYNQSITQLTEQLKLLQTENDSLKSRLSKIEKDLSGQRKYIKKVTGTLTKMSGPSVAKSKIELDEAHEAFEKNKQALAKKLYLAVLEDNKINAAQKNHVYFNLGLLNYWNKKYEKSLVYFSKIYSKYPKSSFAPRSILYIARSFKKMNQKDEANASYQELIEKFPKSKHAKTAKKEKIK